jgi:hypothetical protein
MSVLVGPVPQIQVTDDAVPPAAQRAALPSAASVLPVPPAFAQGVRVQPQQIRGLYPCTSLYPLYPIEEPLGERGYRDTGIPSTLGYTTLMGTYRRYGGYRAGQGVQLRLLAA